MTTIEVPRPTTVDLSTKQAKAAQLYMQHKGYKNVRPYAVEEVEGQPCWYFYYDLPDGDLELEVEWANGKWNWMVTSFEHHESPTAVA